MLLLRLSQYVVLFVSGLVLARALGPEGRSEYALPLALAATLQLLLNLSLESSTGRMWARREAQLPQLTGLLAISVIGLGAVGMAIYLAIGLSLRTSLLSGATSTAVLITAPYIPIMLAQTYAGGVVLRIGAMRAYGWISVGAAVAQLSGMSLLAAMDQLTPASGLAVTVASLLLWAIGLSAVVARRTGRAGLRPRLDPAVAPHAIRSGIALHPSTLGLFLNLRIDLFLVSLLTNKNQTGLYSLSVSLAEFVFLAAYTLGQSVMRVQTEEAEDVAAPHTAVFVRRSMGLALIVALATSAAAYPFVTLVYGSEWIGSVLPLVVLTFAAVGLAAEAPLRYLLIRLLRARQVAVPAAVSLVLNVGLNIALIPALGITGAALASLASYTLYGAISLRQFSQATGSSLRQLARPRAA